MCYKNCFIAFFVALLLCAFSVVTANATVYHEETTKVTNFDYSRYTYTYVEDGIEKTAKLTDEATTPDQIIALLKAVYTDASIPGIHYAYDYNGTQSRKIDYNAYARLSMKSNNDFAVPWSWTAADKANVIPNPVEDGMTCLMVNIKDSWYRSYYNKYRNARDFIAAAVSSVKLMPRFTRVNDEFNPGYLYSFEGVTNRFFIISKGKPRAMQNMPFYRLFEQISPVKGDNGTVTDDFIDEIKAGHSYPCWHDCTSVFGFSDCTYNHWFEISSSGEAYSLNNLTIFIPDRRLEYERYKVIKNNPLTLADDTKDNDTNPQIFKNYENDEGDRTFLPKVLMYTADLSAKAKPSEDVGYYDVTLEWSTSYTKENIGVDVPQHFYVYVVDGNNRYRLESIVDQPTQERSHTYRVQQTTEAQTISYVITAHPINFDSNGNVLKDSEGNPYITISAESPVRTVTIPGHNPFFTQAQEYRSRYEAKSTRVQVNIYKNKMSIRPTTSEDYVSIKNNQEEYEVIRTDAQGNRVTVASVRFVPSLEGKYNYIVTYNEDSQVTSEGLLFDDEAPITNGELTGFDKSTVVVIDRFTASTIDNAHSDKYIYSFEQRHGDEYNHYSNSFTVPVFKTQSIVGGSEHTLADVVADTAHTAKAIPSNFITFNAIYDPAANLDTYEVYRADYQIRKLTKIGKAENFNNSGEYHLFSISEDGNMNDYIGSTQVDAEGGDITLLDYNNKDYNQQSLYVPVITAFYDGDQSKKNTYGCDFKTMLYPQVSIETTEVKRTDPFSGKDGLMMGYRVDLKLTPKIPSDFLNVYYYRVWRVMNGSTCLVTEALLNNQEDIDGDCWASNYAPIKDTYPGKSAISISDIFIDYAPEQGNNKSMTYIARLYATSLDDAPVESPDVVIRAMAQGSDGKDFFIAEKRVNVTVNHGTATAIEDIASDAQVTSVTYYNMLGTPSNRPYPGINIVVRHYSNGTTTSTKEMK